MRTVIVMLLCFVVYQRAVGAQGPVYGQDDVVYETRAYGGDSSIDRGSYRVGTLPNGDECGLWTRFDGTACCPGSDTLGESCIGLNDYEFESPAYCVTAETYMAYSDSALPPANGASSFCLGCDLSNTPCCPDKVAGQVCRFAGGRVREPYNNVGVCFNSSKPGIECSDCGTVNQPCCNAAASQVRVEYQDDGCASVPYITNNERRPLAPYIGEGNARLSCQAGICVGIKAGDGGNSTGNGTGGGSGTGGASAGGAGGGGNGGKRVGLWQQCGGKGWQGPTKCAKGTYCKHIEPYYSQCEPAKSRTGGNGSKPVRGGKRAQLWKQCGGKGWSGPIKCVKGTYCKYIEPYYSQCEPAKTDTAKKTGKLKRGRTRVQLWQQCGGKGWQGATKCVKGAYCKYMEPYYSQCEPAKERKGGKGGKPNRGRKRVQLWQQCGGKGWSGPTKCVKGTYCKYIEPYYSQCEPVKKKAHQ